MRLNPHQIETIKSVVHDTLGDGALVSLFGSRLDDSRRGGDIDLYISGVDLGLTQQLDAKLLLLVKLKRQLGDQKFDIVFAPAAGQALWPIHRSAMAQAHRL
jgi:predicted nucleotidyltransferase